MLLMRLKARSDNILCVTGDFGDTVTNAGIIIKSTLGKATGIVPRWFEVFEVGPDIDWIQPGEWVLVEHGRWTEGIPVQDDRLPEGSKIWKVDPKACLAVTDQKPEAINLSADTVDAQRKQR
jgi:hypothetical protein